MQQSDDPSATWLVSDGAAGNHRQCQALAALLQRAATDVLIAPRAPWSWLAPRSLPFSPYAFEGPLNATLKRQHEPPELVIGCGRQAALATRLLRSLGTTAVQILDPRVDAAHWDAVLVPRHDRLRGPNVVVTDGALHTVTTQSLTTARAQFASLGALPSPRIAVLVGGDTHKRPLDAQSVMHALRELMPQGSLMVTTSRRTPRQLTQMIRTLGIASSLWTGSEDAIHAGESTDNPYLGYLTWADAIVCGADSVSMLSEAAATTAPLYILGDLSDDAPSRFAQQLLTSGRAQQWTPGTVLSFTSQTPVSNGDHVIADLRQILASRGR